MFALLARFQNHAYALLRIVTGLLFLWHGAQKLFGFPAAAPAGLPRHLLYVAAPIELVGGTLVALGLFTRPAAFLCSGLMAAAYWTAHAPRGLFPLVNGGELAALYCFAFLFIAARGAGGLGLDSLHGGK